MCAYLSVVVVQQKKRCRLRLFVLVGLLLVAPYRSSSSDKPLLVGPSFDKEKRD